MKSCEDDFCADCIYFSEGFQRVICPGTDIKEIISEETEACEHFVPIR